MSAMSNGYAVFKESLAIVSKDKTLLLFPILAGIASFIAVLSFTLPLLIGLMGSLSLLFILAFYLLIYFISIFFSCAMMISADLVLKGGKPTVSDGIKGAWSKVQNIFLWALFSATVGVILKVIENATKGRLNFLEPIFGMAWSVVTFFAVPVMIFEDKNPFDALKRSTELFKQRWGEAISARIGLGFFAFLLAVAGAGATVLMGIIFSSAIIFIVLAYLVYLIFLVILSSALNSVYTAALYHYAVTGEVKGGFSPDLIKPPRQIPPQIWENG